MFEITKLIPVSEWVYDLYKVTYWNDDPNAGGTVVGTKYIAASCEEHLDADADEHAPRDCMYMTWDRVKENVGHPWVVGNYHGHKLYESGERFGRRLATKYNMT